nr:hypothetical protein [uncultured Chryseobacterium sp.]
MKKHAWCYLGIIIIIFNIPSSCKNRNSNYITYYQKVNTIDSIYRFRKDTLSTIKQYKKLFKHYTPKNQYRIEEYETYISFANKYHKNFGGKKSLYKLIPLIAPYWRHKKKDAIFLQLFKKYGIDSLEIEHEVSQWKKNLNKKMVDSFTVVFKRDQEKNRSDNTLMKINDKKNAETLQWMFEKEGFPSIQKIGVWNGDLFMPSEPVLLHMADNEDYYPYFKTKLLEYVKSGEFPPRDYAAMVDRNNLHHKLPYTYGVYQGYAGIKDSVAVNHNRKSIGLPTLKYVDLIIKDYSKKNKNKK